MIIQPRFSAVLATKIKLGKPFIGSKPIQDFLT